VESAGDFLKAGLASYLVGLVVSVPFMNLSSYGVGYVGPVANLMGGADMSYFVAFGAALVAYMLIGARKPGIAQKS
jgi:NCS1 family nucleobase:cation symporter-1